MSSGGEACKNKSCIIPGEIHNMKYLVLFRLTEMLREKQRAARTPVAFPFPVIPPGSPARQRSPLSPPEHMVCR